MPEPNISTCQDVGTWQIFVHLWWVCCTTSCRLVVSLSVGGVVQHVHSRCPCSGVWVLPLYAHKSTMICYKIWFQIRTQQSKSASRATWSIGWRSQTLTLHCKTTDTGLAYRTMCLFTSQLSLALECAYPWWDGQAELVTVWLSGNALVSINEVTLRWAQLVPGWVTSVDR